MGEAKVSPFLMDETEEVCSPSEIIYSFGRLILNKNNDTVFKEKKDTTDSYRGTGSIALLSFNFYKDLDQQ